MKLDSFLFWITVALLGSAIILLGFASVISLTGLFLGWGWIQADFVVILAALSIFEIKSKHAEQ